MIAISVRDQWQCESPTILIKNMALSHDHSPIKILFTLFLSIFFLLFFGGFSFIYIQGIGTSLGLHQLVLIKRKLDQTRSLLPLLLQGLHLLIPLCVAATHTQRRARAWRI